MLCRGAVGVHPPKCLGVDLVSLQQKGAVEPALPKATFRPQSDCLWPRGMAGTGTKIPLGESLSAYLQTRVRTPRRQGDVSKRTPKAARIQEAFFKKKEKKKTKTKTNKQKNTKAKAHSG